MPTPPVAGNRSEPGASPGSDPKAPHRIQPVTAAWSRSWRASATVHTGRIYGLAEHRCRTGGPWRWWLTLSPCLFLAALADPRIFKGLITDGTGGGAIGVTLFGLAGGYALSGRDRPPRGSRWRSVRWVGSPVPPHHARSCGRLPAPKPGSSGPGTLVWVLLELTWRRIDFPDLAGGGESRRRSSG